MTPDEMDRQLASIGPAAMRVARKAVMKGIKIIERAQKRAAPVAAKPYRINGQWIRPGRLKASIKAKMSKAKAWTVSAKSGIQVGQKPTGPGGGTAPHGRWFSLGTDLRYSGFKGKFSNSKLIEVKRTKNKIRYHGKMQARPFIAEAAKSVESQVFTTIVSEMKAGLASELYKQGA